MEVIQASEELLTEIKDCFAGNIKEEKNGHQIWIGNQSTTFLVMGKIKSAGAWYYILTNKIIIDKFDVKYHKACDIENCVSHYLPVRRGLKSANNLFPSEHKYYQWMLDSNSKMVNGCKIWAGHVSQFGYGQVNKYLGYNNVHDVSWALANGKDIPKDLMIRHACIKTPLCILPAHLSLWAFKENAEDKKRNIII
jgi:hypothetical protein